MTNDHPERWGFVFASASSVLVRSMSSFDNLNLQMRVIKSGSMPETPSIFSRAPRTETAQNPQTIPGSRNTIWTLAVPSSSATGSVSLTTGGAGTRISATTGVGGTPALVTTGAGCMIGDDPPQPAASSPRKINIRCTADTLDSGFRRPILALPDACPGLWCCVVMQRYGKNRRRPAKLIFPLAGPNLTPICEPAIIALCTAWILRGDAQCWGNDLSRFCLWRWLS